jgi:hypothetical protein
MSTLRSLLSLRNVLLVDAATCGVMGALLAPGANALGDLAQIPPALLFYAGLSLFPTAAFMAIVATRPSIHETAVWLIIAGNALWVAGSFTLVLSGWIAPNALGSAFIVAQALIVAVLAKLEHAPLRGGLLRPRTS